MIEDFLIQLNTSGVIASKFKEEIQKCKDITRLDKLATTITCAMYDLQNELNKVYDEQLYELEENFETQTDVYNKRINQHEIFKDFLKPKWQSAVPIKKNVYLRVDDSNHAYAEENNEITKFKLNKARSAYGENWINPVCKVQAELLKNGTIKLDDVEFEKLDFNIENYVISAVVNFSDNHKYYISDHITKPTFETSAPFLVNPRVQNEKEDMVIPLVLYSGYKQTVPIILYTEDHEKLKNICEVCNNNQYHKATTVLSWDDPTFVTIEGFQAISLDNVKCINKGPDHRPFFKQISNLRELNLLTLPSFIKFEQNECVEQNPVITKEQLPEKYYLYFCTCDTIQENYKNVALRLHEKQGDLGTQSFATTGLRIRQLAPPSLAQLSNLNKRDESGIDWLLLDALTQHDQTANKDDRMEKIYNMYKNYTATQIKNRLKIDYITGDMVDFVGNFLEEQDDVARSIKTHINKEGNFTITEDEAQNLIRKTTLSRAKDVSIHNIMMRPKKLKKELDEESEEIDCEIVEEYFPHWEKFSSHNELTQTLQEPDQKVAYDDFRFISIRHTAPMNNLETRNEEYSDPQQQGPVGNSLQ